VNGVDGIVTLLPPRPSSAGVAREVLAWQLREWHIECLCDDAAVVVTELISNAVRHARTEVELKLVHLPDGVRMEVRDGCERPLERRPAADSAESGRGLHLVDALVARHGVDTDSGGKRVWVEMLTPA
jgi:anti-sigma regulatory factor (Ser/Thr protein kinase)